jgi:2,3-bisphosphoglycerate-dependent phosphoglycerate mutase
MKLYFVRHGESVANLAREFSNTGLKHPLTPGGIEQAHQLARTLACRQISRLFSSPLLRAVQTAEILAQAFGLPVDVTDALREWNVGIFEGTSDELGWRQWRRVQEDWFLHRRLDSKIPEGESFLEMRERFVPFITTLVQQGQGMDDRVVLVGHGGLYSAMLPVVLRNLTGAFAFQAPFPHTAYVLGETRPDGLYCVEWCGMPLLEEQEPV